MSIKLRLRPEVEDALRAESERTGRSVPDLIREALDQYLAGERARRRRELEGLYSSGILLPAAPYSRTLVEPITLPPGMTSADLLDREDRF